MIIRVTNNTDGNLTIEALRTTLSQGESKDVDLGRRPLSAALVDGNAELAQLVANGSIVLIELDEVFKGWVSGWTNIAAGATLTFDHNLGVVPSRMLVDVMANDGVDGTGTCHYIGYGGDVDDAGNVLGYVVSEVSSTQLKVVRGTDDAQVESVNVRIKVEGT